MTQCMAIFLLTPIGPIQGFRTPALTSEPRAHAAGVRKAPRHEIAVGSALAVPPALWGFGRGVRLEEVGAEGVRRSVCRKILAGTQG